MLSLLPPFCVPSWTHRILVGTETFKQNFLVKLWNHSILICLQASQSNLLNFYCIQKALCPSPQKKKIKVDSMVSPINSSILVYIFFLRYFYNLYGISYSFYCISYGISSNLISFPWYFRWAPWYSPLLISYIRIILFQFPDYIVWMSYDIDISFNCFYVSFFEVFKDISFHFYLICYV